jgi:hypothetical protein
MFDFGNAARSVAAFEGGLPRRKMKKAKFIVVALLAAALIVTGGWMGYQLGKPAEPQNRRVVSSASVVKEIQQLNELITVRHVIVSDIELKQERGIFRSEEKIALLLRGIVEAGVQLNHLTTADVEIDDERRSVTLTLPAPVILKCYVDDQHTRVLERTKPWFVSYDETLDQSARQSGLAKIRKDALELGILEQARKNAEASCKQLLGVLGFEKVSIRFREAAPDKELSGTN